MGLNWRQIISLINYFSGHPCFSVIKSFTIIRTTYFLISFADVHHARNGFRTHDIAKIETTKGKGIYKY
jgi:hypothetical protein